MNKPYLVLGLDPGIASCGFALIDTNNHQILEMGSHLFDAPQEDKTKVSLAVGRRNARSARRNNQRTKARQKHCLNLLIQAGMVPEGSSKQWMQSKKGDRPLLELRFCGLERLLSNREFAQVLYSLSARRGYIPHGEGRINKLIKIDSQTAVDEETGKVLKSINQNSKLMKSGNYRTIGEMFFNLGTSRNKDGNYEHCVLNTQVIDEVHKLFEAQRMFHNPVATSELEDLFIKNLTWEKKTLDHDAKVYNLVGTCSYFPHEKRAALADFSSELCRAYERFGHLRIVNADGNECSLCKELINTYLTILFSPEQLKPSEAKITYARIRKDLDLSAHVFFKGIDIDDEKRREVFEPKAWRSLRGHLSSDLMRKLHSNTSLADDICEALTYASSEDSLLERLNDLSLTDADIDEILSIPFTGKLFKGYGSRSRKALEILLDAFEDSHVLTLTEAEDASGLLNMRLTKDGERFTLLPPYTVFDPQCKNPVILRSMSRMRHIINSIIRIHGVPDEIHIELGRELKHSKHEKEVISKRNRKNERNNKEWSEQAAKILGINPEEVRSKLLKKIALYEEQEGCDAYTGASINFERLISDDTYCEIDHVLPYSRTCDDSRNNKVLVLSKSNQDKRERTPFEWMTQDTDKGAPTWSAFQARVIANHKLSPRKRSYLLNNNLGPDQEGEFLSRNLNDDRYMSRTVKNFLEKTLLFPDDGRKRHVIAVAGGATASLRHVWGLNFGVDNTKDRSDDRHHAVDACVIAACSESTIKKVARARSYGYKYFEKVKQDRLKDTQPWLSFADEVIARKEFVVPTRMVSHGVTGRAFEDTNYHFIELSDDKKQLAVLRGNGKLTKKGNYVIGADGNAHILDGMAFLRLWLDPNAKKGKGKWYVEPVYYADIPAIMNGSYTPKAGKSQVARAAWKPVPASAMTEKPIVLFRGDVIKVGDCIGRFWKIDVSNLYLEIRSLITCNKHPNFPTIGKWNKELQPTIIQEDCLGHCYDSLQEYLKR